MPYKWVILPPKKYNLMVITALRQMSPKVVSANVSAFREKYVQDWERWLATSGAEIPFQVASILRKWQAGRGKGNALRRSAKEVPNHPAPYVDDIVEAATSHLNQIKHLTLGRFERLNDEERTVLTSTWIILGRLRQNDVPAAVAITKAVLLLTRGHLGPAFDSQVTKRLGAKVRSVSDWLLALVAVSHDISAFEERHQVRLQDAVPGRFGHLAPGRLYDMALGPRTSN